MKKSKGERLGWKSYSHLPKQQIQIEMQKEFAEALKKELNKMDEYIILNKKIVKMRLKLSEGIRDENIRVNIQDELNFLLTQSTPLIPELDKVYTLGLSFNGKMAESETFNSYIKNLKLGI